MTPAEWSAILIALIGAGLLKYAVDFFKWLKSRREEQAPERQRAHTIATVDASLAVVARARDELEADNDRLRRQMAESDARHEDDRARWELRDKARREEIEVLERKLRALLHEVEKLKDQHTFDEIETTRNRMHTPGFPGPLQHP